LQRKFGPLNQHEFAEFLTCNKIDVMLYFSEPLMLLDADKKKQYLSVAEQEPFEGQVNKLKEVLSSFELEISIKVEIASL